jgi:hypothetical protein
MNEQARKDRALRKFIARHRADIIELIDTLATVWLIERLVSE